jgi:hypothetical protein
VCRIRVAISVLRDISLALFVLVCKHKAIYHSIVWFRPLLLLKVFRQQGGWEFARPRCSPDQFLDVWRFWRIGLRLSLWLGFRLPLLRPISKHDIACILRRGDWRGFLRGAAPRWVRVLRHYMDVVSMERSRQSCLVPKVSSVPYRVPL